MEPNYRRCVSCRRLAPKEFFLRLVRVHPSGQVELERGMGRSAYLCPKISCFQAARKKNRLGRALRTRIPDEIYQALGRRIDALQASENSSYTTAEESDS